MKLRQLFEQDTKPFVVSMLQKLLDRDENVYVVRHLSGGTEASRIVDFQYTPSSKNIGGGLHFTVMALGDDNRPHERTIDLVHSIGADGAASFDERWTISTINGLRMMHLKDKKQDILDLQDDIHVTDIP